MRRRLIAVLGVAMLVLASCGDDDDAVGTDDTIDTPTTVTTEAEEPTDPPEDPNGPDDGDDPDADRPPWTGSYEIDYETGDVDISEYAAFLDEHGTPSGGIHEAALEMLDDQYTEGEGAESQDPPAVSSFLADGGRTVVSVTFDGLLDDSVAAVRFELVFVGDDDDVILESGSWASRCQPGRGHEEFAAELCV